MLVGSLLKISRASQLQHTLKTTRTYLRLPQNLPLASQAVSMSSTAAPQQTAVHVTSFDTKEVANGWANIKTVSIPKPTPNNGEALVRITARAVNPSGVLTKRMSTASHALRSAYPPLLFSHFARTIDACDSLSSNRQTWSALQRVGCLSCFSAIDNELSWQNRTYLTHDCSIVMFAVSSQT